MLRSVTADSCDSAYNSCFDDVAAEADACTKNCYSLPVFDGFVECIGRCIDAQRAGFAECDSSLKHCTPNTEEVTNCYYLEAYAAICAMSDAVKQFTSARGKVCNPLVLGGLTATAVAATLDPVTAPVGIELAGVVITLTEACKATDVDTYIKAANSVVDKICDTNQQALADKYGSQCLYRRSKTWRGRFYVHARRDISSCPAAQLPAQGILNAILGLRSDCYAAGASKFGQPEVCLYLADDETARLALAMRDATMWVDQLPEDMCTYGADRPQPSGSATKRDNRIKRRRIKKTQ